jgi:hypothetical protein
MPSTPAIAAARIADWMGSASTSHEASRSAASAASFTESVPRPRRTLSIASSEWPKATPMLRCEVESVRSRCRREVTSVEPSVSKSAAEISRFASAFSNRMGLILCGIADDPMDPGVVACAK